MMALRIEARGGHLETVGLVPGAALFPPGDGDSILARLFGECAGLRSGIALVVEIGRGQLDAVRRHAGASGLEVAEVREDYAGIPRTVVLRRP